MSKLAQFLPRPVRVRGRRYQAALKSRIANFLLRGIDPSAVLSLAQERFGAVSITVSGRQGIFEGGIEDRSIITKYGMKGEWSKRTIDLVMEAVGKADNALYLDIGANVGLTSIPIAARGVETLAFEPEPKNFGYLKLNMLRNGVDGAMVALNLALSNEAGPVLFEKSPNNLGDHRIRAGSHANLLGENDWAVETVNASRLDDCGVDISRPLAIKVDTQGAEPFVYAGGVKTFAAAKLVILEFSPYAMYRMGADPAELIEYLSGFRSVSFGVGEGDDVTEIGSGEKVAEMLSGFYRENWDKPVGAYVDIIARR